MTEIVEDELGLEICVDAGETDDMPEVTGSEAAFLRYRDEARALPREDVIGFRGHASLAFHNVERGVKAVSERRETIEELPGVDVDRLIDLPNLAIAVVYAADLAARAASEVKPLEYPKLLSRAHSVRRLMLFAWEACAEAGIVSREDIVPIRAGHGPLDLAGDVVALAALFRKHGASLKNKTPVTSAHLEEANEVGTALQVFLKPKGTPVVKEPRAVSELTDDRDRLWTLLVRGHGELQRVAGFLFGSNASIHVPALQSRLRSPSKASSA